MLAIGDGALGFWNAVGDIWPETREQRSLVHRLRNVLDKLPKRLQAKAKRVPDEIMNAGTRNDAETAMDDFEPELGAKPPRALASLLRDREHFLTFFDFPAEHGQHIRCTNAIESPFATVRRGQRVTKGAGSRTQALLMAYKLLETAELRWCRANSPELVAKVRYKDKLTNGTAEGTERKVAA